MAAPNSYDIQTSTVEFDYNYSGSFTSLIYNTTFSAFSTTAGNIVSVTVGSGFQAAIVFDAGYFSHVLDNAAASQKYGTSFDVGYSSEAASGATTTYTPSAGALTSGTASPNTPTEGYGTLELGGSFLTASTDSIGLKGIDNTLVLDSPTLSLLTQLPSIAGFNQAGDQIVLNGILDAAASIVGYNNGVLTFSDAGTNYALDLAGLGGTVSKSNFSLASAAAKEGGNSSTYSGDIVIDYVPCFLAGTMIATPAGETAIERIRPGDLVTVLEADGPVSRPVVWTSGSTMRVHEQREPDAALPVRILRHAFAMNVPHRDLLVTPEHCILTEAGLVPTRMLVNGASILIDRSITEYQFFHIELERHGILLSEGLSTESYLDTGNRTMFGDGVVELMPRPGLQTAAPLAVTRSAVEPIWNRLADRARGLGLASARPVVPLTDQPDLRLLLDDGRELTACWHSRQRHMFHVPQGTRPLRLMSRAAVPAESVGPFVDDRRRLGIAVEKLVLWTGLQERVLPVGGLALSGWHGDEGELRWTDGNAALDLPCAGSETFLDIHVAGTMLYPADLRLAA